MTRDPDMAREKASLAANTRWGREKDRTAATAPARQGFLDKLYREAREDLGPDATDEQLAKAVDNKLAAHAARMRMKARLNRQRKAAEALLDEEEAS